MKKQLTYAWIITMLLSVNVAHAARFTDLSDNSPYKTAIDYLSDVGVIQGYPDQTFHPDQKVNRVEFLKLVIESSDVETDITTPTSFPDVDETAWYAKYVRKAQSEGWIEGYSDGTFKPEQSINKAEALKIIGEVQEWKLENPNEKPFKDTNLNDWFTPYVSHAKQKNFLEERTSLYFPELLLTRAQISELLFRSYITRKSESDKFKVSLAKKYPPATFIGVGIAEKVEQPKTVITENKEVISASFETFPRNFFDDITLNESFPNTFYKNEVYFIEGTIHTGTYDSAFIFLAPEGTTQPSQYRNHVMKLTDQQLRIPVIFREEGNFKMGLVLGSSGESKIANISVLPSLPSLPSIQNNSRPTNPNVAYQDQKTTFSWDNNSNEFIELNISQNNASKTFYFRQGEEDFTIDYTDFIDFDETTTQFTVKGAMLSDENPLQFESNWSTSSNNSFKASQHAYSKIFNDLVTVNNITEVLTSVKAITFTGTAKSDLFVEAAVIKPDGFVELFDLTSPSSFGEHFGSATIKKNNSFTFNYKATQPGTYIVEVNGTNGSAVINTPLYVANGIPLTPDFFDLNIYTETDPSTNITNAKNELLQLINADRTAAGLSPVVIDGNLSALALAHSNDMLNRNFFGHVNPDGFTPDDRRLNAGIPMPVGENLAISPTALYTHKGLMQSGIHRNNILNPDWTKVGIGIAMDTDGSLYTTQEFSSSSYTAADLNEIQNDILSAINEERSNMGLSAFQTSSDVQLAAEEWSTTMATENFFNFTTSNGDTLSNLIIEYAPGKPVQALILESTSLKKLQEEAAKSPEISNNMWGKIGIGVKNDSTGSLKTTILFTTY